MSFILVILVFLLISSPAQAQIVINEVFPAPEQGSEWIELYNTSGQEVALDGWLLEDQLSSPSIIALIENQILLSQNFLVIELSSAKLNNSADGVILKNSQLEIIDQMNYESSKAGLSWAKNSTGVFELTSPTKNTTNIFPSPSPSIVPTPTPSSSPLDTSFHHLITISEFSACPNTNEDEWIKLYNADSQPHSISSWQIRDLNNQTRQLNTTLVAGEYKIISWSGSLLNNNGDEFYLENEFGESWQNIKYNACQFNTSYTNINQEWVETSLINSADKKIEKTADLQTTFINKNTILVPPILPLPLYLPQQIILNHNAIVASHQTKLTNIIAKEPPREAVLIVILGGSLLLFSNGWKIHEKISQRHSDS